MGLIKRFLLAGILCRTRSWPPSLALPARPMLKRTTRRPALPVLWNGTLRVTPCMATLRDRSRCGAVNNITFTIIQDDSQVSGHYTCAIGTAICRNGNDAKTGKITSGKVSGKQIRFSVLVPSDVSNCNYTGYSSEPGTMRGGYSCYQGGGLIEQGMFQVTRLGG